MGHPSEGGVPGIERFLQLVRKHAFHTQEFSPEPWDGAREEALTAVTTVLISKGPIGEDTEGRVHCVVR